MTLVATSPRTEVPSRLKPQRRGRGQSLSMMLCRRRPGLFAQLSPCASAITTGRQSQTDEVDCLLRGIVGRMLRRNEESERIQNSVDEFVVRSVVKIFPVACPNLEDLACLADDTTTRH